MTRSPAAISVSRDSGVDLIVKSTLAPIAYDVASYLGQHWFPYSLMVSRKLRKSFHEVRLRNLVAPDTGLCIEAPAGSGSSFFVRGFASVNPDVRLAHHHHVAAQVKRAVELGVPTVVLLRDPTDCVTSRACQSPWMIGALYRQWIRFFRAVKGRRNSVLIASFETVIADTPELIRQINERFCASFTEEFPASQDVYATMDGLYTTATGLPARNPNRPSLAKRPFQQEVLTSVKSHRLASTAGQLYDQLRPHAT